MEKTKIPSITPILLAGGNGTRLWPVSRKTYPKQFYPLLGSETLFQSTVNRFSPSSSVNFKEPTIMTSDLYRFIVLEQLNNIGKDVEAILIEPQPKNTAASVLAATLFHISQNPETILLVTPSDHVIPDRSNFHSTVAKAASAVTEGNIVLLGIKPDSPNTGYGYLELNDLKDNHAKLVKKFIEKPKKTHAERMVKANNYFWNAGILMFRAKDMLAVFKKYFDTLIDPVQEAIIEGALDLGFFRLDPKSWSKCQNISIDFAILEKLKEKLLAVTYSGIWSDVGSWDNVWEYDKKNDKGVVSSFNTTSIDCSNSLLRTENEKQHLVGIGLKNLAVISMSDSVLVADLSRVQEVGKVVKVLTENNIRQAKDFPRKHRPWGWYEELNSGNGFVVRSVIVHVGKSLTLQIHKFRSEHWVVVEGEATVEIEKEVKLVCSGESIHIPSGSKHKLSNFSNGPVTLIEIQTGVKLGEGDIIRY